MSKYTQVLVLSLAAALVVAVFSLCIVFSVDPAVLETLGRQGAALQGVRSTLSWLGPVCAAALLTGGWAVSRSLQGSLASLSAYAAASGQGKPSTRPELPTSLGLGEVGPAVAGLAQALEIAAAQLDKAGEETLAAHQQAEAAAAQALETRNSAEAGSRQGMLGAAGTLGTAVGHIQGVAKELGREVDNTFEGGRTPGGHGVSDRHGRGAAGPGGA